jgi:hypothetical protein
MRRNRGGEKKKKGKKERINAYWRQTKVHNSTRVAVEDKGDRDKSTYTEKAWHWPLKASGCAAQKQRIIWYLLCTRLFFFFNILYLLKYKIFPNIW